MRFDLASLSRRARNTRRASVTFRDIVPPATFATDLYLSAFAPTVALWQRHGARIAGEYERTLSALMTDAPIDLQTMLEQAEGEFSRLFLLLRPALTDWSYKIERWQRGKWRGAALAASGVDLETIIGPADVRETLDAAIEWNVSLVRDVSQQARQRMSTAVFDGLRNRTPARDVAKSIREASAMSKRRSLAIASDQLSKVTSSLAAERRRQAGLDTYEYMHSGKLHPRSWHKARNGFLYSESAARVGTTVEGKTVRAEIAADDRAGVPPYCACRERAVLSFD